MNILALDLGTKTGWALRLAGGAVHSGTQEFKPVRFEGGGMRYLKFSRWLSEVLGEDAAGRRNILGGLPLLVVFEEVRNHGQAGVDAAHAYGGFMATLTSWCEAREIAYMGTPVGTIKKHATGKGNAGKAEVMAEVRRWGYKPGDDNEADALAIMSWAIAEGPIPVPVFVNRDKVIDVLVTVKGPTNATPGSPGIRPAPDSKPRRQVSVGTVPLALRRATGREGADAGAARRPDGCQGLPPSGAGKRRR